jgi:hypothetical protein
MSNKRELVHCRDMRNGHILRWEEKRPVYHERGRHFVNKLGVPGGVTATQNDDGSYSVDYTKEGK